MSPFGTLGTEKVKSLHIIIPGQTPAKKNSRNIFVKNGRIINIPSQRYYGWHNKVGKLLLGTKKVKGSVELQIEIWMKDKRRRDLSNMAESLLDLLVDKEIIEDDSWKIVSTLHIKFGGIDRINPRAEIWIKSKKNRKGGHTNFILCTKKKK